MKVLVFSRKGFKSVYLLVLKKDNEGLYYFYGTRRKMLSRNIISHVLNSGVAYKTIIPTKLQYIYSNLRSLNFSENEIVREVKEKLIKKRIFSEQPLAYIYEVEV